MQKTAYVMRISDWSSDVCSSDLGASAVQLMPHVAEQASELLVFQRTPPWLAPTPNYQHDLPSALRWLMDVVPDYAHWDRLWQFWRMHEGLLPPAYVHPEWPDPHPSVSHINAQGPPPPTPYPQ